MFSIDLLKDVYTIQGDGGYCYCTISTIIFVIRNPAYCFGNLL